MDTMVPVINHLGLIRDGKCGMQLEEQVWYNTANIKQLDEKIEDLSELPIGVEIGADLPDTATNGTITQEQLDKLKEFEANYIIFKDEIYMPQDKMTDEDYLTYTHVTVEQGVKTITINLSTKAFVLTQVEFGGGGALYEHTVGIMSDFGADYGGGATLYLKFLSSSDQQITTLNDIAGRAVAVDGRTGPLVAIGTTVLNFSGSDYITLADYSKGSAVQWSAISINAIMEGEYTIRQV